jgi:hypothetical protein
MARRAPRVAPAIDGARPRPRLGGNVAAARCWQAVNRPAVQMRSACRLCSMVRRHRRPMWKWHRRGSWDGCLGHFRELALRVTWLHCRVSAERSHPPRPKPHMRQSPRAGGRPTTARTDGTASPLLSGAPLASATHASCDSSGRSQIATCLVAPLAALLSMALTKWTES